MYPQSMFWAKVRKKSFFFHLKITIFTAVKYHNIMHGRVRSQISPERCTKSLILCCFLEKHLSCQSQTLRVITNSSSNDFSSNPLSPENISLLLFKEQCYTKTNIEVKNEEYLSSIMRKPAFCICENKDEDQLRGNRAADQHMNFR